MATHQPRVHTLFVCVWPREEDTQDPEAGQGQFWVLSYTKYSLEGVSGGPVSAMQSSYQHTGRGMARGGLERGLRDAAHSTECNGSGGQEAVTAGERINVIK